MGWPGLMSLSSAFSGPLGLRPRPQASRENGLGTRIGFLTACRDLSEDVLMRIENFISRICEGACFDRMLHHREYLHPPDPGGRGDPEADVQLGHRYFSGEGVPRNYAQGIRLWTKTAERGNAEAQWLLGGCYELGYDEPKNPAKAVSW
jgi:TPR repeat protein